MEHYLSLFIKSVFIENMALSFFWVCVRFGGIQKVSTAFGLGVAVIFVLGLSVPANQLVYSLLKDGAIVEGVDLTF
ncbi:Na(+)-translocating NADH-quinone reductase subunit E [Neisseria gonorrhoeae]|uniref:Na(+)-translocating NADH-quinone reductase subunit E n=1 Tax=Neisseria gonorrhoeae TaxID=485 RepID=A0A378VVT7_NEIGO|nr:Na(+)-translocating NADH-quinone reductase subunit E [Neisseria gonorrhoeae]